MNSFTEINRLPGYSSWTPPKSISSFFSFHPCQKIQPQRGIYWRGGWMPKIADKRKKNETVSFRQKTPKNMDHFIFSELRYGNRPTENIHYLIFQSLGNGPILTKWRELSLMTVSNWLWLWLYSGTSADDLSFGPLFSRELTIQG